MSKTLTKQLLLSGNYWVLNKDMVQLLGLETAFLLSNFAEAEQIMADKEGWFYQTADTVETMTTLSRHKQDQCIKQLEGLGVLGKDVRGMPAKRYFKINYKCLTNLIVNFQQTGMRGFNKLDCKKSATNKERTYKERTYKENTNKSIVADATPSSPKESKYDIFFKTYNEQGIIQHQKLTNKMKQAIDRALRKDSQEDILTAISRYGEAFRDKDHKFSNYKMTLDKLLTQSNGYYDWLDEGQKWINYQDFKKSGESHGTADKKSNQESQGSTIAEQAGVMSF